jgi:hypothetical protein
MAGISITQDRGSNEPKVPLGNVGHSEDLALHKGLILKRILGWVYVELTCLAQGLDQWLTRVNNVMHIWVPWYAGNFLSS